MNIKEDYMHLERDNDYELYWFVNNDVIPFHTWYYEDLKPIIEKWTKRLKQALYIKWNYLFFTIDNKKYWLKLSCSTEEWDNINDIINDFNGVKGVKNVIYEKGVLD